MSRRIREPGSSPLLGPGDPAPMMVHNPGAASPFQILCDHAGRAVPAALECLGLPEAAFETHIAWDIGALGVARSLAERLDAGLIAQPYCRLVIDCNRGPGHPQAIPVVSDSVAIPGNAELGPAERAKRLAAIHEPYHRRIADELDARAKRGQETILVCQHSFTPVFGGLARPWHIGVLHDGRSPMSIALLALLGAEGDLVVGDNQPYALDATDHTVTRHALTRGLDFVEIELRQDLIAGPAGQAAFADRLARLLPLARKRAMRSDR